jgi:hypothetical protein
LIYNGSIIWIHNRWRMRVFNKSPVNNKIYSKLTD